MWTRYNGSLALQFRLGLHMQRELEHTGLSQGLVFSRFRQASGQRGTDMHRCDRLDIKYLVVAESGSRQRHCGDGIIILLPDVIVKLFLPNTFNCSNTSSKVNGCSNCTLAEQLLNFTC
jgi:hypothetical protein